MIDTLQDFNKRVNEIDIYFSQNIGQYINTEAYRKNT